jgi:hypothetical protein
MILAAEVLIAMTVARLFPTGTRVAQGAGIVGLAIVFALGAGAASRAGLHAIFGQEIRNVPFLVGRLIVDGPGQWYLREVCAQRNYVACRFKDTKVTDPAEFIWVGQASPLYVNDPEERRRFLDEQWAFVRGTITRFPLGQSRASLANVVMQLRFLDIETHTGTSLPGLLHEDSYRTQTVLEIVPHIAPCLGSDSNRCSYDSLVHPVQRMVRYTIALAAVAALAFRLGRWLPSGQR